MSEPDNIIDAFQAAEQECQKLLNAWLLLQELQRDNVKASARPNATDVALRFPPLSPVSLGVANAMACEAGKMMPELLASAERTCRAEVERATDALELAVRRIIAAMRA